MRAATPADVETTADPFGRGFLTGRIKSAADLEATDWRLTNPRFQPEAFEANAALAAHVEALAAAKGCTAAQVALAWVCRAAKTSCPSPGPSASGTSRTTSAR